MFAGRRNRRSRAEAPSDAPNPLKREGLDAFKRLLSYLQPHKKRMAFSMTALLFSVLLGLALPLAIRELVDDVLAARDLSQLNQLAGILFAIFILQAIFSFIHRLTIAYVGENIVAHIRVQVYSHLQRLSLRYYADHRTGEIVSRLTNDVTLLQEAITNNIVSLFRQALTLIGAAAFLFYLNLQLTLIILVGIPLITLTIVFLGRRIRQASKDVQDALAEAANVVEETTAGIRIVKSFAREAYEISRFSARVTDTFDAAMRRAKISATLAPIIGFLAFASITLTLWFGSYQVISGDLSEGGLVAYFVYTMMVATPVSILAGLYAQFQSALGATERLFELLDTPSDIVEQPSAPQLPLVQGKVIFEDVSFDYTASTPILKNISFEAEPGQVIALVGPSGAGKTTLVNLIPRFYDVAAGQITIDGQDIRAINLNSLREQIGIVPQETILFSDTVRENIRYGKLDATEEEIVAAAKAANAHTFITSELPDGYDTLVGERGVKLSGGQRQRVAIARAILKDPRILILDEATSSLDSESEQLVQDALEQLMAGRTSFVIAHRLSTVINADLLLVIDAGRLVEMGSHAELLADPDGLYRRLYTMQFERELTQPMVG